MTILLYDLVGKDKSRPFSPHCWKTKMTLAHLGLEFETVPTAFTQIPTIENGSFSKLPTIRDRGDCMQDSFEIARHYAAGTPLMGGKDGEALIRFCEAWSQTQLHTWLGGWLMLDIHNMLEPKDQQFFRASREKMFGKSLEEIVADREKTIPELVRRLLPMKLALKHNNFIGGEVPDFADYIVFGAFQWLRVVAGTQMIPADHPVTDWLNRCLDLHNGLGRTVAAGG